jgi:HD-GYP domain-containing protein (c-di-GMP phosphodiesterase class II)
MNTNSTSGAEQDTTDKLELLYNVSKTIGSVPRMTRLLEQIIEMTQKALHASAASIMLVQNNEHELFFEAASGPVEKVLKHVKVNSRHSIAGQVLSTGKPLIVNDVKRNDNFLKNIDEFTGFITKSLICVPLVTYQKIIGVLEVINKLDGSSFEESDLHVVVPVAMTAAMAIENTKLHQKVLNAYKNTIETLAEAIDSKELYSRGHSQRIKELSLMVGESLKLSPEEMETLEYASILHDIGKIAVDSDILNKPGSLTPTERNIVQTHPIAGANLLKKIPFLEKASELVLYHHERYDGTGYPGRLKGEDIPQGARIIAMVDAFDTMTTARSYRSALDTGSAIKELQNAAGTQFCPIAVKAFVSRFYETVNSPSNGHNNF